MVLGAPGRVFSAAAIVCALLIAPAAAPLARAECRVAELNFHPVSELQVAIWVEDAQGHFVDTLYITRATGSLGLANRPGRLDFNSEILWPYGRRENVLPVWAHRRGVVYPRVVFQDGDENDLSHAITHSSPDPYYCRPLRTGEDTWTNTVDSGSCATSVFTDKGKLSSSLTSLYPPRNDLDSRQPGDANDMKSYGDINGLDAITRATPPGDRTETVRWAVPNTLPPGDYVVWLEVSRESDFNASYSPSSYPSPVGIPWSEYGHPYRGQPSIVWRLPFTLGHEQSVFLTDQYAGYGDPDGIDGTLSPPDATITTVATRFSVAAGPGGNPPARTVDNLGAARLQLEASREGNYQLRLDYRPELDDIAPAAPSGLELVALATSEADLTFVAPGDDGLQGSVTDYEIRYGAGDPPDQNDFVHGTLVADPVRPAPAGQPQAVQLSGLYAKTHYWVGVRAHDNCLNPSPIAFTTFVTPAAEGLAVDACFVATAAWGGLMETHVAALRGFRDRVLREQVLGEIFVEAYYTFGPAMAEVIRPSDDLRAMTRRALSPLVAAIRTIPYASGARTR